MAWINAAVEFNGVTYLSHHRGAIFVVPYVSGLEVGDSFKANKIEYEVLNAENLHGRGECLVMDVKQIKKEVSNDKSKTRRDASKSRGKKLESQSNDGLPSED